tara:strand:+ start:270 stop:410 length:141 start_codon:yes stop_codon:yes gene_type:complete
MYSQVVETPEYDDKEGDEKEVHETLLAKENAMNTLCALGQAHTMQM